MLIHSCPQVFYSNAARTQTHYILYLALSGQLKHMTWLDYVWYIWHTLYVPVCMPDKTEEEWLGRRGCWHSTAQDMDREPWANSSMEVTCQSACLLSLNWSHLCLITHLASVCLTPFLRPIAVGWWVCRLHSPVLALLACWLILVSVVFGNVRWDIFKWRGRNYPGPGGVFVSILFHGLYRGTFCRLERTFSAFWASTSCVGDLGTPSVHNMCKSHLCPRVLFTWLDSWEFSSDGATWNKSIFGTWSLLLLWVTAEGFCHVSVHMKSSVRIGCD